MPSGVQSSGGSSRDLRTGCNTAECTRRTGTSVRRRGRRGRHIIRDEVPATTIDNRFQRRAFDAGGRRFDSCRARQYFAFCSRIRDPLPAAVLTGKYTRQNASTVTAARGKRVTSALTERNYAIVDELIRLLARSTRRRPPSLSPGCRHGRRDVDDHRGPPPRPLEQNLAALDVTLYAAHVEA
jgi:hypothetical protein